MDHLTIFDLLDAVNLRDFQVKQEIRGQVIHARYDAVKKDGVTPAPRFIELLVEKAVGLAPRKLRWRTGFLYNERAVFRPVPHPHVERWQKFALHALYRLRDERAKELVVIDELRIDLLR